MKIREYENSATHISFYEGAAAFCLEWGEERDYQQCSAQFRVTEKEDVSLVRHRKRKLHAAHTHRQIDRLLTCQLQLDSSTTNYTKLPYS